MRLLSFDTSRPAVHVALLENGRAVCQRQALPTGPNRQESASMLIPEIEAARAEAGWTRQSIDLIVVGVGPGSFTGIRAAAVTARSLAQALGIGLIGISCLETQGKSIMRPGAVILRAGKGRFFAAAYGQDDPLLERPIVKPVCCEAPELEETLINVPFWYADAEALPELEGAGARIQPLPVLKNIALTQAEIAWDRLSLKAPAGSGAVDRVALSQEWPWMKVEPLYLRAPSVTIKKNHGHSNPAHDTL